MATRGGGLHDSNESVGINYPDFATYSKLLTSGHVNDTISNAAQAVAANVPYPIPGSADRHMPQSRRFLKPLPITTLLFCKRMSK